MSEELMEWYNTVPYAEIKNIIRDRMSVMAREYVGIGFYLRRVRDNEMYLEDGYKDVHEFAAAEFGMSRSTVNHCMRINEQFSVGGNSPTIDSRYKDFNKSQLQEMLYLSADKLDNVTPDMTIKEIRNVKNDRLDVEPEADDQIPGQMTIVDFPECMPENESGTNGSDQNVNLRKPTQEEKNILAAFARKLIRDKKKYFLEDFAKRVTDVTTSGALLYQHLGFHRTWYFKDTEDNLYHINLFESYIQLWSEDEFKAHCVGDYDWFYLMVQVQSQWNIVAMEDADKQAREKSESVTDGTVIKTDDSVIKPDEIVIEPDDYVVDSDFPEEEKSEDEQIPEPDENWNIGDLQKAPERYLKALAKVLVDAKGIQMVLLSPGKYLSDESIEKRIKELDKENGGCIHLGNGVIAYASHEIIEFFEGETDLGVCSYKRFATQARKAIDSWNPGQDAAENTDNHEMCCENSSELEDATYSEIAIRDYLEEEENTLAEYERVNGVEKLPLNLMIRQRMLVKALKLLLENEKEVEKPEDIEEDDIPEQPELPVLKNNDQRKEWLKNYKAWGLWYRDENIDVNYYKYDFCDGSRLVVAEYPQREREGWWSTGQKDEYYFHLLEKNKKKYSGLGGVYDEKFRNQTDSETYMVDFLKEVQKK